MVPSRTIWATGGSTWRARFVTLKCLTIHSQSRACCGKSGQRRIETIKCSLLAIDKLANVVDTNVGQAPQ